MNPKAFENAFDAAAGKAFGPFKFDEPSYDMLVIEDEQDYLAHLKVQAAGMAYYYALAREAERRLEDAERAAKLRQSELYDQCAAEMAKLGKRPLAKEIDSFSAARNRKELAAIAQNLSDLRAEVDYANAFLEGWRQKSFTLSAMNQMVQAGLLTPREAVAAPEDNPLDSTRKISVRSILSGLQKHNAHEPGATPLDNNPN
ncbi:MAG: hypothetical protein II943_00785 [Victivallales bacterium]|nr:hypothetical protein [Victivallales bacterium]